MSRISQKQREPRSTKTATHPFNERDPISSSTALFRDSKGENGKNGKNGSTAGVLNTCYHCRSVEKSEDPFVRCSCSKAWHCSCYKPSVRIIQPGSSVLYQFDGQSELYKEFVCKMCQETNKNTDASTSSCSMPNCDKAVRPSQNSMRLLCPQHALQSKSAEAPNANRGPKTCEHPACTTLIDFHKLSSSSGFCKVHEMAFNFQRAIDAKKAPLPAPPEPRPFKKRKLYPMNDEGPAIMKEFRSREPMKKQASRKPVSFNPPEKSMHQPAVPLTPTNAISRGSYPKQTEKSHQSCAVSSSIFKGIDTDSTSNAPTPSESSLTGNVVEVENVARIHAAILSSKSQPAQKPQENTDTLAINPPSQDERSFSPAVSVEGDEDSPDSQLAQEFQASNPSIEHTQLETQDMDRSKVSSSGSEDMGMTYGQSIEHANEFLADSGALEDEDGDENLVLAATLRIPPGISVDTVMKDTASLNIQLRQDSTMPTPIITSPTPEIAVDDGKLVSMFLPANSLELARVQRVRTYDSSDLDSWLAQEPAPPSDFAPSSKELLESQSWRHLDPRRAWPPVFSEDWLRDKKEQIKARGGRKANYGKIISTQYLQERDANGWNIHQSQELKEITKERQEVRRKVDDLFGVDDVDGMVPRFQDGLLYMVDAPKTQTKGKREARKYLV